MTKETFALLCAAFVALLAVLAVAGVLARRRRQRDIEPPLPWTDAASRARRRGALRRDDARRRPVRPHLRPRPRLPRPHAGRRSTPTACSSSPTAPASASRPSASARSRRATWTIDRVVEPGGIVVIAHELGADVDTYLRFIGDDREAFDALRGLVATRTQSTGEGTSTTAPAPPTPDAALVLEDGTIYRGAAYGATGRALGEAVFATGMTGYQETLTDPSYAGQIVVQTSPHIGNTGVNAEDAESRRAWPSGYVVRGREPRRVELARRRRPRHAARAGRRRRDRGRRHARDHPPPPRRGRDARRRLLGRRPRRRRGDAPRRAGQPADGRPQPRRGRHDARGVHAARGRRPARHARGARPRREGSRRSGSCRRRASTSSCCRRARPSRRCSRTEPIAAFYSNGPGDPAASERQVELLQGLLREDLPFFGICFGNQLLGRALGFGTYKLPFGHRGINQPVLDTATGRVEITSQNHGFAVDAPLHEELTSPAGFGRVEVSHYSLNDEVVEGLRALDIPAFSVQYHPESAAGPNDARHLFGRFRELVLEHRAARSTDPPTRRRTPECPSATTSAPSSSSAPGRSSSARPPSSTTPAPRRAGCCARRACASSS